MHRISFDETAMILLVKYQGAIQLQDLQNGLEEAVQYILEHQVFRVLIDCREMEAPPPTLELYELPETFSNIFSKHGLDLRKMRRALLVKMKTDTFSFIENVAVNRGYWVKVFDDEGEAREWLSNDAIFSTRK